MIDFQVVPGVFTVDECVALLEFARRQTLEPQPLWVWLDACLTSEPTWAGARLVECALRLNEKHWHRPEVRCVEQNIFARMPVGGWIPPHIDWHDSCTTQAALVAYLVDPLEYEGGDLLVEGQREPLRPAQGSVAVFPNNVTMHAVAPVYAGERWTIGRVFVL